MGNVRLPEMQNSVSGTQSKVTGRCHFGRITYVALGAPRNVRICHCHGCQQLTGSAFFARALFARTAVTSTGSPTSYDSSGDLTRQFCPVCSSMLFAFRKSAPDTIAVAIGTLDVPSAYPPDCHIWTESRISWLQIADHLPQFERFPSSSKQ